MKLREGQREDGEAVCFDSVRDEKTASKRNVCFCRSVFGSVRGNCACYYYQYSVNGF